jgi:glycosyltransferase involved in cell wall biosynthesis
MMTGQDILCFAGEDWWYHNPHSNLHIMKTMASRGNRVLFVNSIGVRMPNLKDGRFALKKIVSKAKSMLRYLVLAERNIYVLTPIALPYLHGWEKLIHPLNTALVTIQLRVLLAFLRFHEPILWVCVPTVKDIVFRLTRSLKQRALVYYCVDNITYHSGEKDLNVLELETELHAKADVALFVNRRLIAERLWVNPNTFHLEHGVDYEHFARAQTGTLPMPPDIACIPKPIIGYIGVLRGLDYELIRYLSENNPDFSFVFIGEVDEHVPLKNFRNIHLLGKKQYEELPNYMQAIDCLTILYRKDDVFNNYRNPKKLLEYFASGRPVVSIPIFELAHFEKLISLATGPEEFSRILREAVFGDSARLREQRIAYAKSQTWNDVAEKASAFIEAAIRKQPARAAQNHGVATTRTN